MEQKLKSEEQDLLLTPREIGIAEDSGIKEYLAKLPSNYDDYLNDKDGYKRSMAGKIAIAQAQLAKALKGKEVEIEQAKCEERERIIKFIDWLDNGTRSSASWRSEVRNFRQAIKEGEL